MDAGKVWISRVPAIGGVKTPAWAKLTVTGFDEIVKLSSALYFTIAASASLRKSVNL